MRVFKLKKGGETENVIEATVVLTRDIDDELIEKAINMCAEKDYTPKETIKYLDEQFNGVNDATYDGLKTFYC